MSEVESNKEGWFGPWGGSYVPETLVTPLEKLSEGWKKFKNDSGFQTQLEELRRDFIGRPTPLYYAQRLSEHHGFEVYLKREDLAHTGAHKINNTIGQVSLAKAMGKTRVIAETGAGQHGVATAAAAARAGLECDIYMGTEDMRRQALNVKRIQLFGATVIGVDFGSCTLKEAMSEAMRNWVQSLDDTHYVIGSAAGPYPYPDMVREFNSVIGCEAKSQFHERTGGLPNAVIACVGGGSNAIGLFEAFIADEAVRIFGVEAAGKGLDSDAHAATLTLGSPGVLHGFKSYLLQNSHGQISSTHSISAGLDYPGVGPQHAWLKDTNRAQYFSVTDAQALEALLKLTKLEGILPALETAHALAGLTDLQKFPEVQSVIVNLSGRGDKDTETILAALN